jgi:hypothetical protein
VLVELSESLDFPKSIGKSMTQLETISRCDSRILHNVLPDSSSDCSRGYRSAMKILCPDSEFTQKTSLDTD